MYQRYKTIIISVTICILVLTLFSCAGQSGLSSASETSASVSSVSSNILSAASSSHPENASASTSSNEQSGQPTPVPIYRDVDDLLTQREEIFTISRDYPEEIKASEDQYYWMPDIDNNTTLDELIEQQVISGQSAWAVHNTMGNLFPSNLYRHFEIPLSFFRQPDEHTVYTVYKVNGGGWLYVFFTNVEQYKDDRIFESFNFAYVFDRISFSDFSDVQIGDSIDEVIMIDRVVERIKLNWGIAGTQSISLLTDGIMIIDYAEENGEIIVSDMSYRGDYIYDEPVGKFNQRLLFKLLPQDYPQ